MNAPLSRMLGNYDPELVTSFRDPLLFSSLVQAGKEAEWKLSWVFPHWGSESFCQLSLEQKKKSPLYFYCRNGELAFKQMNAMLTLPPAHQVFKENGWSFRQPQHSTSYIVSVCNLVIAKGYSRYLSLESLRDVLYIAFSIPSKHQLYSNPGFQEILCEHFQAPWRKASRSKNGCVTFERPEGCYGKGPFCKCFCVFCMSIF